MKLAHAEAYTALIDIAPARGRGLKPRIRWRLVVVQSSPPHGGAD